VLDVEILGGVKNKVMQPHHAISNYPTAPPFTNPPIIPTVSGGALIIFFINKRNMAAW
jgi:hypothetical protein